MIAQVVLVVAVAAVGPVVLRSGERVAPDAVEGVDAQGVLLKPSFGPEGVIPERRVVPWVEVASVGDGPGWGEAEPYREIADALDRAERRLARSDVAGARRLLEPLAPTYLGGHGPTTAQVASALAACRVLRDDRPGAVRAWLVWRETTLGPARAWLDPSTGLMPALPPVWRRADALAVAASFSAAGEVADERATGEVSRELASMYELAARHAAGEDVVLAEGPSTRLRADAGVRLVWEMVRAQVDAEPAGRQSARDALRRRLRGHPTDWEAAWVRLGLGASLLAEPERTEADAGAAELLIVVFEHQDVAPGIADLAAAMAVEHFESTDRPEHARAVRAMDRAARMGLVPASGGDGAYDAGNDAGAEDVP